MSSDRARMASLVIAVALALVMVISGMASAMVDGMSVSPHPGAPRALITDLPTDLPTCDGEIIIDCITPLPSLSTDLPTDLPTCDGEIITDCITPLPSISITPLPSISLTPLPSVSVSPLPSVTVLPSATPTDLPELPEVTPEQALEIANGVEPPAGDPDTGLLVTAHYGEGNELELGGTKFSAITLDLLPSGGAVTRAAATAQGGVITQNAVATSSGTGSSADGECSDGSFSGLGVSWKSGSLPIRWKIDRRSMPAKLPRTKAKRQVNKGLKSWSVPRTKCSSAPNVAFSFDYRGKTRKNPKRDGVSVVDWGALSGSPVALTYTWYVGDDIVEFDMRLNKRDYKWTVAKTNRRRFQVSNTVSHETGHALGLGDLSDPHGNLTMFGIIFPGELKKTSLGRGDLDGASAQSP